MISKKERMQKREDAVMDGDGEVTMRHMDNKIYCYNGDEICIACKWAYNCKTWLGICTHSNSPLNPR